MNLTSKSRYALKIMMDLAHYGKLTNLVRRGEIAARQGIPTDYLDQIMIKLRAGHLVESIRGRSGGYRLARSPQEISMWDLFYAVEECMIPVECVASGSDCDFERSCSSREAWGTIFSAIKGSLSQVKLGTLADQWAMESPEKAPLELNRLIPLNLPQVQECRSGGRCSEIHPMGCANHHSGGEATHHG